MKVTESFRDAQALAEFLRLEELRDVENFRNNYPDFLPVACWEYKYPSEPDLDSNPPPVLPDLDQQLTPPDWALKQDLNWDQDFDQKLRDRVARLPLNDLYPQRWKTAQLHARGAWKKHFALGQWELLRLLVSVFTLDQISDLAFRLHSDAMTPHGVTFDLSPTNSITSLASRPFQRAITYLVEQPWRAKNCEWCGTAFVAGDPRQKYCGRILNTEGETCFTLARKEQKQKDHLKHRKARNEKRRVIYRRRTRAKR